MLEVLNVIGLLPLPAKVIGVGIFLGLMYWILHRFKYSKDPYFPPFVSPPHEKVIVVLTEKTTIGLSVVDIVNGKWGNVGVYVPVLNKIYKDVQFMSGRKKVIHLTKGVDGIFRPAGLSVVEIGSEFETVRDDEGRVVKIVKHKKEKVISGKIKDKETFLTMLLPSIEEYRLTLTTYIESAYALAQEEAMKNVNPGYKGWIAQMLQGLDKDKLLLLASILAFVLMYLLASDSLTHVSQIVMDGIKTCK